MPFNLQAIPVLGAMMDLSNLYVLPNRGMMLASKVFYSRTSLILASSMVITLYVLGMQKDSLFAGLATQLRCKTHY